jgi:hypothetical protein
MSNSGERQCPKCGRTLPLNAFSWDRRSAPGHSSRCHECKVERKRRWREANPERVAERNAARRVGTYRLRCEECGEEFEAGRSDRKLCSRRCKDARYRRLHPEQYHEKQRRYSARRREREAREE